MSSVPGHLWYWNYRWKGCKEAYLKVNDDIYSNRPYIRIKIIGAQRRQETHISRRRRTGRVDTDVIGQ
jgi:hypothetical protein